MNDIFLRGIIRDIQPSHSIKDIDYDQAHLIVKNSNNEESVIDLVFKHFTNKHKDGDHVALLGNIRTFSKRMQDGSNRIRVYVFTYFDTLSPDEVQGTPVEASDNYFQIDGHICKLGALRKFKDGKCNIQLTIANNISKGNSPINSYIPCIAWGRVAKKISKMSVGDSVAGFGELRSHQYVKNIDENTQEIRVAHEALLMNILTMEELEQVNNEEQTPEEVRI